jgi:RIO kinase 1
MSDELEVLLADGVIDEILGRLKSGKEANISLVRRGDAVIAAKVYKDRATRSFKNNSGYKEGRKVRNSRTQRAMDSGGQFGRDAAEQAWKSAEADALYKLVGSGVRVPEPLMFYEGVLLMDVVCDAEGRPAPRLIDVAIERDAAIGVYADIVAQLIAMLCCDLIHGDLSPYNILAAAEGPTIIDFPQVISAVHNTRAEFYFLRDFDNIVRFLAGFDPSLAVHTADGRAIWRAYVSRELTPQFVPPPPPPPRATRGPDRRSRPDQQGRPRGNDQQGRQNNGPRPQQNNGPRPPQNGPRPPQNNGPRPPQNNGPRPPQNNGPRPPQDNGPRGPRNYGSRFADDQQGRTHNDQQGRPNDGRPNDGRPNDGRPNDGRPNDGRPNDGRANDGRPNNGRPNDLRPNNGRPNDLRPNNGRPNDGQRLPQNDGSRVRNDQQGRSNDGPRPLENNGPHSSRIRDLRSSNDQQGRANNGPRQPQNNGPRQPQNNGPRPPQSNGPRPAARPAYQPAPNPSGGHRRRPKRRF